MDFDPFANLPDPESGGASPEPQGGQGAEQGKKGRPKKKVSPARKIAYTAVGTALALAMIALTCYVPVVTIAPLIMISVSYNIVADKCGIGYGIVCMLASVGLGFLVCIGAIGVMLIVLVVFVPYSALCFLIRPLGYTSVGKGAARAGIVAAFGALETFFVWLLGSLVFTYVNIGEMIDKLMQGGSFAAGYLIITVIAMIIFIAVDIMYMTFGQMVVKKLK